jgi:hypothetical protein
MGQTQSELAADLFKDAMCCNATKNELIAVEPVTILLGPDARARVYEAEANPQVRDLVRDAAPSSADRYSRGGTGHRLRSAPEMVLGAVHLRSRRSLPTRKGHPVSVATLSPEMSSDGVGSTTLSWLSSVAEDLKDQAADDYHVGKAKLLPSREDQAPDHVRDTKLLQSKLQRVIANQATFAGQVRESHAEDVRSKMRLLQMQKSGALDLPINARRADRQEQSFYAPISMHQTCVNSSQDQPVFKGSANIQTRLAARMARSSWKAKTLEHDLISHSLDSSKHFFAAVN